MDNVMLGILILSGGMLLILTAYFLYFRPKEKVVTWYPQPKKLTRKERERIQRRREIIEAKLSCDLFYDMRENEVNN